LSRIAVIGSGISGMSAAYFLSRRHEVTLFEREQRLGGHTHTVSVAAPEGRLPVDTGFIVHNVKNYPNLSRLLRELRVATQASDMSFSVSDDAPGLEWSSREPIRLALKSANLFDSSWHGFLGEIARFNRRASALLDEASPDRLTLSEYLRRERFGDRLRDRYLYPLAASVWSASPDRIDDFPAATLVRFFKNHGFLGFFTQSRWRSIRGGSASYIPPLTDPYRARIRLSAPIERVTRNSRGVSVLARGRELERFDEVVFACHGDQVLPMLGDPTAAERSVFSAFKTSLNQTKLHTDTSVLPRRRRSWASWNFRRAHADPRRLTVTYHMNRLQALPTQTDYCVSLNTNGSVDPARVLRRMEYRHPLFTRESTASQLRWAEVSGVSRTHYCGAYWGYGFHEDGLNSALQVAERLGVTW
jgi:predicted NAD/FAD-binding protein